MKHWKWCGVGLSVLVLVAGTVYSAPDTVKLNDGRVLTGSVETGTAALTCVTEQGRETVPLSEVEFVDLGGEAGDGMEAEIAGTDFSDVKQVLGLAAWARQKGVAKARVDALYRKALALDAENAGANLALGNVKFDGRWMSRTRYMIETGHVLREGKWVSMDDAARSLSDAIYAERSSALQESVNKCFSALLSRDRARVSEAYEQLVALDAELPGMLGKGREVKAYAEAANDANVLFDGKVAVLELRVSNASIDWSHPLRVTLTGDPPGPAPGLEVTLPLPRQRLTSIKTHILCPG